MDVKNNYVLNTVAAAAADISVAGSLLTAKVNDAGLSRVFNFSLIQKGSWAKEATVAEVLQISTVTYTFALNKVFSFHLKQRVGDVWKEATISVDSSNPGMDTDAKVAAAILAKVIAHGFKITPSGAASPVTLTALTRYPQFIIQGISNVTVATGTPGVYSKNIYADLVAAGITGGTAASTYTKYSFKVGKEVGEMFGKETSTDYEEVNWYLNNGDGDTAALITRIDRWAGGLDDAGAVANPELVGLT